MQFEEHDHGWRDYLSTNNYLTELDELSVIVNDYPVNLEDMLSEVTAEECFSKGLVRLDSNGFVVPTSLGFATHIEHNEFLWALQDDIDDADYD